MGKGGVITRHAIAATLIALCTFSQGFAFSPFVQQASLHSTATTIPSRRLFDSSHQEVRNRGYPSALPRHYDVKRSKRSTTKLQMIPITDLHTALESTFTILTNNDITTTLNSITRDQAEALAGPFFGASLFPYLLFLYFLDVPENDTPKGVTIGFATCLLFVFLTIPAAIAAQVLYGVSLADSDWLHGSAESLLTITNLVTVVAFRQALQYREQQEIVTNEGGDLLSMPPKPASMVDYQPMINLVTALTAFAALTALVPALLHPEVHTPYLAGVMDLPQNIAMNTFGAHSEPENALTVACWIIHVSSLVEFLVAMGFAWRWADISGNPKWKGLTWGLIPLHSSGITACTYHLFYNAIPILVPIQAFLTCVGNTTAAYAAYRIAISNGWKVPEKFEVFSFLNPDESVDNPALSSSSGVNNDIVRKEMESPSLIGFEDLGDALANDTDYSFLLKLFGGCAVASYAIKYGELFVDFPFEANVYLGFAVILIPSLLNAFKWYKRSLDPTFEGWF